MLSPMELLIPQPLPNDYNIAKTLLMSSPPSVIDSRIPNDYNIAKTLAYVDEFMATI